MYYWVNLKEKSDTQLQQADSHGMEELVILINWKLLNWTENEALVKFSAR